MNVGQDPEARDELDALAGLDDESDEIPLCNCWGFSDCAPEPDIRCRLQVQPGPVYE